MSCAIADPTVRTAGEDDAERAAWLVARALADDPVAGWVVPIPLHRKEIVPRWVLLRTVEAVLRGSVQVVGGFEAVAVWVSATHPPRPPQPLDPRVAGPYVDRVAAVEQLGFAAQPADRPHHRLAFLAVRDVLRGQGIGSRLVARHHVRLDEVGLGAYTTATTPAARRFYERLGYADLGRPRRLPEGPPVWPMWRPAGG